MVDVLLLRLDAPLMSFGGPMVDNRGITAEHPLLSLLTGLIGNALGYHHRDTEQLHSLQARLEFGTRRDRGGTHVTDYQTVDLGQSHMHQNGWTTRGVVEERSGGTARLETHIRYRDYLADAVFTLAITLRTPDASPTLDDIARSLDEPSRPLFIGRKCCLPSVPILLGRTQATSILDALRIAPALSNERAEPDYADTLPAWWTAEEAGEGAADGVLLSVVDERDWHNQIHSGRRLLRHGRISLHEEARVR